MTTHVDNVLDIDARIAFATEFTELVDEKLLEALSKIAHGHKMPAVLATLSYLTATIIHEMNAKNEMEACIFAGCVGDYIHDATHVCFLNARFSEEEETTPQENSN